MIKVIERKEQEFIPKVIQLKLENKTQHFPLIVKHNSRMWPEVKEYGGGGGGGSLGNL